MLTVLLPNYRTPELTRLCLRSLRLYSDLSQVKIIAIDNASGDESTEYLRSLPWIRLIERTPEEVAPLAPADMHSTALDLALKEVDTEFVISMHTDTILLQSGWLDYLMSKINRSPKVAGVGSWKLEYVPPLKQFAKAMEDSFKQALGLKKKEFRFLRSHCALYRTELLKKHTRGFGDGECAGSSIHKCLLNAGYELDFLPVSELSRYMVHMNHATMILNPVGGSGHKTNSRKAFQSLCRKMQTLDFIRILEDDSLDGR